MPESFQPDALLRILAERDVHYVLIGGLAATLHGSPHLTQDVDITPERTPTNLAKLSDALRDMNAQVRAAGLEEPLPFSHDAASLGGVGVWNLATPYGDFDISFVPTGTEGYPDLCRDAVRVRIADVDVVVASLSDIIRSKQAADRPKDRLTLPTLREILARRLQEGGTAGR